MKRILVLIIGVMLLTACGSPEPKAEEPKVIEKKTEMTELGVKLYLNQMTSKYSIAFTGTVTEEGKMNKLNEAISDINLSVQEIEDGYEAGTPPIDELYKLAVALKKSIKNEMLGEKEAAHDDAHDAGVIIGDLSREYLGGELPIGIQLMVGKENADD